jgi:hypothetical protein
VTLEGGFRRTLDTFENMLFLKSKISFSSAFKILFSHITGISPLKLLFCTCSLCNRGRPEKLEGMDPLSKLLYKFIVVMFAENLFLGISPVSLLEEISLKHEE